MRLIFSILLLFVSFTINAQDILKDMQNYKSYVLPNGMKILVVQTKQFQYLNYRISIDYYPQFDLYPSIMEFWAAYNGFELNGKTELYANKVSDTNAIDSMFFFFNDYYFHYKVDESKFLATKKLLFKKYRNIGNTDQENWLVAKKFCFGKKSIYAQSLDTSMLDYFTVSEFQSIYSSNILPQYITIAVVGDISPDTVFKYAVKNFSTLKQESKPLVTFPETNNLNSTRISFVDDTTNSYFSLSFPVDFFYTNDDYWQKAVVFDVLKQRLKKDLSPYVSDIKVETPTLPYGSYFKISAKYDKTKLYDAIFQISLTMSEFVSKPPTDYETQLAREFLRKEFDKTLKNPYQIAEYITILHNYKLDNSYFFNVKWILNRISSGDAKRIVDEYIKEKKWAIVISGTKNDLICQLYKLASIYGVDFYDNQLHKYKIISKGFDCNYIFNAYLKSCGITNKLSNVSIKYTMKYFLDTVYTGDAVEYFKKPGYFYFKSRFFIDNDTVLQIKQIFDTHTFYQADALGEHSTTDDSAFFNLIWGNYMFQEKYYDDFNYHYEFVCDTALLKRNTFKIKVTTPYNVYFYNYYNFDRKEKDKTEILSLKNGKQDTLSIIYYTNYRYVDKNSKIKLPYTIEELRKGLSIDMTLKDADFKKKIPKSIFAIPKK